MATINILGTTAILLPLYLILVTVYRLTLHPLSKYPGPFWWKVSGWPDGLAASSGNRHLILHQLHGKYGPIVRIGPNRLSYNTVEAFHDIHSDRNANVVKSGFVGFARAVTSAANLQQIIDKREHAQRRKIIAHAFTENALKSAEYFMLKQINNWTNALAQGINTSADGWSDVKNLSHWANLLTLDIFGELCFGEDFGATNSGDNHIIHSVMKASRMSHAMSYNPLRYLFIPVLRSQRLLKLLSRKAYESRWSLRESLTALVTQRHEAELTAEKNSTLVRKDIFHYVLQGRDDTGALLPKDLYLSEAVLLIGAGTETTSTAISAALYYLTSNPDKLATLRTEIDAAFTSLDDIHTGATLSSLTYLRACIDETIRVTPPVPGSLARTTLRGGHTVIGTHIPEAIELEVSMYGVTHNASSFLEPTLFLPERWISGAKTPTFTVTDELLSQQRHAFVPFSTGPRNCLGMRMAYMEMGLVMARLVWLFDWKFDVKQKQREGEFETQDWFVSAKEGPWLTFRYREGRAPKS